MAKKPRITDGDTADAPEDVAGASTDAADTDDDDEAESRSELSGGPCRFRCAAGQPTGELTIAGKTVRVVNGVTDVVPEDMHKSMAAMGYQKFGG